jgi:hypothetical protein
MLKDNTKPDFLNQLILEPLTRSNWDQYVRLFGEKGACGNCWCMYYGLSEMDFVEGKTDDSNKKSHTYS